jgi:protein-tyrosine sulfotransferase
MGIPIFILSTQRSGSTLLRYLLDAHPAICCPAELRLGLLINHLTPLVELTTASSDVAAGRSLAIFKSVRRIIDGVMDEYCRAKGKDRWCEKSPVNLECLNGLAAVFPDAQYICLHRHGLDVVRSIIDADGPTPPYLAWYLRRRAGNVLAAHVDRWSTLTERLLAFEQAYRAAAFRLTYERLVREPEVELAKLLTFLHVSTVEGLSKAAFTSEHDPGPGDVRIRGTTRVVSERIGMGGRLDTRGVPEDLLRRFSHLLTTLGYS